MGKLRGIWLRGVCLGGLLPGGGGVETLPGTATAAEGTHPTGIHSCIKFIDMKIKLTCITYRKLHIGTEAQESKANKVSPRRVLNPSGALTGGFASRSHNRLLPQQAESANSEGNCNKNPFQ